MRINTYVAQATGLSRRDADAVILAERVSVNGKTAQLGQAVNTTDHVTLDEQALTLQVMTTIMINKPAGYVSSRDGQGNKTIYDLLPARLYNLKPVGRLDKDSSGLLLLTNDGQLAQKLTHPSFEKQKIYEVELDKPLTTTDKRKIERGVKLEDGVSKLQLNGADKTWSVTMHEGRNRQIRRTFAVLEYRVMKLNRTGFGNYQLDSLAPGSFKEV